MTKKYLVILLGLTAILSLAGCGSEKETADSTSETEFSTAAPEEIAEEDLSIEELEGYETEAETEVTLDPITPSDYLIENSSDYVTPTVYEGLEVTQYVYEITDEMIQEQIDADLEMYSEEIEVERASQIDDLVYVDMTYTAPDSESVTESTYFSIGMEEYGAEFDEKLTGVSAGDTLDFSITFDDTCYIEDWIGQTIDFEVTVSSVCELSLPEYSDEYVQEYTDYSTTSEYEASLRESMEQEYAEMSYSETMESLFAAAIEQSVYSGYPEELFDACKEEVLSVYQAFADSFGSEDIYELFEISEEEIDAEAMNMVNRRLFVSRMCEEKDIEVTSEEYMDYVTEYASYYGYENAKQFEDDYTRASIVWSLYESKAGEILYDAAKITEEPYEEEYVDENYLEEEYTEEDVLDEELSDGVVPDEEFLDEEFLDEDVSESETDLLETEFLAE